MSERREVGPILQSSRIVTPIGPLTLISGGGVLFLVSFRDDPDALVPELRRRFGEVSVEQAADVGLQRALGDYFDGSLDALERIEVDPGGTGFQQHVWHTLRRSVPAGSKISYGELAERAARPDAVRAVGAAMAANPIPIVIPCHRVLAADGQLWRYGGGLDRKRWLLQHEGALPTERTLF